MNEKKKSIKTILQYDLYENIKIVYNDYILNFEPLYSFYKITRRLCQDTRALILESL